jgi:hypothetical protein
MTNKKRERGTSKASKTCCNVAKGSSEKLAEEDLARSLYIGFQPCTLWPLSPRAEGI